MNSVLISVGLPYQKWDQHLEQAIVSVQNQSVAEWELLIQHDAACNGAHALPPRLNADPRIHLECNGRNLGLAHSLNRVAARAKGGILFRMDADDIMHPNRIRATRDFLLAHKLDVVGTRAYVVDEDSSLVGLYKEGPLPTRKSEFLKSNAFTHPTVAGRTEWFLANPYDTSVLRAEDKDLWLRTHENSRFGKLATPLLYYRIPRRLNPAKTRRTALDNIRVILKNRDCSPTTAVILEIVTVLAKFALQVIAIALHVDSALVRRKAAVLNPEDFKQARENFERAIRLR